MRIKEKKNSSDLERIMQSIKKLLNGEYLYVLENARA